MKKLFFILFFIFITGCSKVEDKKTYYICTGQMVSIEKMEIPKKSPQEISLVINWTKKTYQLEDWIELNDYRNIPVTIDSDILFGGKNSNNTFQFNKATGNLKMTSFSITIDKSYEGKCLVVTPKI
jgi:hypothetical protein